MLFPMLVKGDSVGGKYFQEIVNFSKHWNIKDIPTKLYFFNDWGHEETEIKRFKKINEEMRKKYPLLFKTNNASAIINCDDNSCYKLDSELAKELADYINLVDCNS